MLKIPDSRVNEFGDAVLNHKVNISAMNVYFQNIRMINGRHKYVNRDMYNDIFRDMISDIELVSSPIDSFVPCDDTVDELFLVNQLLPEYVSISERITLDVIKEKIGNTDPIVVAIVNNECKLSTIIDDIYIYYCLFKYLDMIDIIRIKSYSYLTPIIEWIVNDITLKEIKDFIHTRKINNEKYIKNFEDLLFNPDFSMTQKFYAERTTTGDDNLFCEPFDVHKMMTTLASNIVLKTDSFWILGIYMICSFAMFDKANNESPCVKYVNDIISKIL